MTAITPPRTDAEVKNYIDALGLPGLIDMHVHFMPHNVLEKVWHFFDHVHEEPGRDPWPVKYKGSEEERIQHLRDMGVTAFPSLNYAHKPAMAAWLNEFSATFAKEHPDAIHSATFYPEPGVTELVEKVLHDGAAIFKVHVQVGNFTVLDPLLQDAWGLIEAAKVPVIIHCGNGPHRGKYTGIEPIRELVGQFPELVLVIAHCGLPDYSDFGQLALENPKVYLDTTMVGTSFVEKMAPVPEDYMELMAKLKDKVVLGTDFPNISYDYAHQIEALHNWGLGEEWMRNVLWNTPKGLLKLDQ